jgi:class 3 adenylate cyclase/tetratricopeptide (TPR) repeat protein
VLCSACGVANDAGRKFCKECGQRLAAACPSCGASNSSDDKFCGECGVPLTLAVPRPIPGAPTIPNETERKLVTVLFVDLVGFTPYSEAHDSEDVRTMLGRYFEAASDAVHRHGGKVEKFIGDAVMAVWGTPVAHEDDAERAVRSALEIVDRVEVLGNEIGESLRARAGVLTGEAVATVGAIDQGLVTGDLVNTASRLQSAAEPGAVLVGERTQRSASKSIVFVQVDDLTLKGKQDTVPAWRAVRVVGEVGGSNRGTAPEPPFIGRDAELRMAKELLHSTGRENRPKLLTLAGVAGIGKSRLSWELQKYIDGLSEIVYWHEGRCPSYGEGVSFWALAEMVRYRARISDTDTDGNSAELLDTCLTEYVADVDERVWLRPRLGHLIGIDPSPGGSRDELFGAWRRFFERVAEHGTVVLGFEDLQWADPGLLDFIESLLEWTRNSPILVVASARPELMERRPTWGAGSRSSITAHLDRLSDPDIRTMVEGYVDGLPETGLDSLVARAEGVPLYAVETVRMLADRGVLEQVGESYRRVGDLSSELDIPETLHALVAARLDGLPDDERSLVQDAAVAGHSFTVGAVSAISGLPTDDLEPKLRALVRKEVLDQDHDPRSPERGQYRFVQSVIREVAYSTLSKGARRAKHLASAEWLESLGDEELAGVVASHYLEAYRSEPSASDAEIIGAKARDWLVRSAERAFSLGSPAQAVGFALQAKTMATTATDRAALAALAARGAMFAGQTDDALTYLHEGLDVYRSIGDIEGEALLLTEVGRINYGPEDNEALTKRLLEVESLLPADPSVARAETLSMLADRSSYTGQAADAVLWSDRAMAVAGVLRDKRTMMRAARARGWALVNVERHWEAKVLFLGVLDLARELGDGAESARSLVMMSIMAADDEPHEALGYSIEAGDAAGRLGLRPIQITALNNSAEFAMDLGRWDLAPAIFEQATEVLSADPDAQATLSLSQAMLAAHRGHHDEAKELTDFAESKNQGWESVQFHTWFLRIVALRKHLAGDSAGALVEVFTSLDTEPTGVSAPMTLWVGIQAAADLRDADAIGRLLTTTAGLSGQWSTSARNVGEAVRHGCDGTGDPLPLFHDAFEFFLDRRLPLDHAITVLCAVRVLPVNQRPVEHIAQARTYLEQLDAVALLALLDKAEARA